MAKLIYEYQTPDLIVEDLITEAGEKKKKYKIKGIFSTIGEKNRNGRIYPKELWESEVEKYQEVIKSGSINRLCEWQHPERSTVDPMEAVAAVDKLFIKDNFVMGEATLLDNAKANQLKSLIDNGIKLSVSSRGLGNVGSNGVVEKFQLITYDLVDIPSDYNATMSGFVSESVKNFEFEVENKENPEIVKRSDPEFKDLDPKIDVKLNKDGEPEIENDSKTNESESDSNSEPNKDEIKQAYINFITSLGFKGNH